MKMSLLQQIPTELFILLLNEWIPTNRELCRLDTAVANRTLRADYLACLHQISVLHSNNCIRFVIKNFPSRSKLSDWALQRNCPGLIRTLWMNVPNHMIPQQIQSYSHLRELNVSASDYKLSHYHVDIQYILSGKHFPHLHTLRMDKIRLEFPVELFPELSTEEETDTIRKKRESLWNDDNPLFIKTLILTDLQLSQTTTGEALTWPAMKIAYKWYFQHCPALTHLDTTLCSDMISSILQQALLQLPSLKVLYFPQYSRNNDTHIEHHTTAYRSASLPTSCPLETLTMENTTLDEVLPLLLYTRQLHTVTVDIPYKPTLQESVEEERNALPIFLTHILPNHWTQIVHVNVGICYRYCDEILGKLSECCPLIEVLILRRKDWKESAVAYTASGNTIPSRTMTSDPDRPGMVYLQESTCAQIAHGVLTRLHTLGLFHLFVTPIGYEYLFQQSTFASSLTTFAVAIGSANMEKSKDASRNRNEEDVLHTPAVVTEDTTETRTHSISMVYEYWGQQIAFSFTSLISLNLYFHQEEHREVVRSFIFSLFSTGLQLADRLETLEVYVSFPVILIEEIVPLVITHIGSEIIPKDFQAPTTEYSKEGGSIERPICQTQGPIKDLHDALIQKLVLSAWKCEFPKLRRLRVAIADFFSRLYLADMLCRQLIQQSPQLESCGLCFSSSQLILCEEKKVLAQIAAEGFQGNTKSGCIKSTALYSSGIKTFFSFPIPLVIRSWVAQS